MKYNVQDANITVIEDEVLVAGEVKIHYAEFTFDDSWNEYDKIAVFKNGAVSKEQLLDGDKCEIPWEVLEKHGILMVGIFGMTSEKRRPTLWAPHKFVNAGTERGEESREPTPDIYQQLIEQIDTTVKNSLKEAEESGEFDGTPGITPHIGKNGNWYIGETDTGVKAEGSEFTEADKEEIVASVLAALPNGDEVSY